MSSVPSANFFTLRVQTPQLPRYTSERVLREKLLQAVFSGAGFDLS